MHKRLAPIPVILLTFLIGLTVHFVFRSSANPARQQNDQALSTNQSPISVSTCDLLNNPAHFRGKRVRVYGILYGDFLLYGNCSESQTGLPVVSVTVQGFDSELNGLWGRLHGFPNGVRKELDVRVEGVVEFDPNSRDGIKLNILADGIIPLSPLRTFKLRGAS